MIPDGDIQTEKANHTDKAFNFCIVFSPNRQSRARNFLACLRSEAMGANFYFFKAAASSGA